MTEHYTKSVCSLTYCEGKLLRSLTDFPFVCGTKTELVVVLQVFVEGEGGQDQDQEEHQAQHRQSVEKLETEYPEFECLSSDLQQSSVNVK